MSFIGRISSIRGRRLRDRGGRRRPCLAGVAAPPDGVTCERRRCSRTANAPPSSGARIRSPWSFPHSAWCDRSTGSGCRPFRPLPRPTFPLRRLQQLLWDFGKESGRCAPENLLFLELIGRQPGAAGIADLLLPRLSLNQIAGKFAARAPQVHLECELAPAGPTVA